MGVYAREMAIALADQGAEAHLVVPGDDGASASDLASQGRRVTVHHAEHAPVVAGAPASGPPQALRSLALMHALLRAHERAPFDAIEIQDLHGVGAYLLQCARATPAFDRCPITVRLHGPLKIHRFHHRRQWLSWTDGVGDWFEAQCLHLADARSAPTRAMLDMARAFFKESEQPGQPEHVIANPLHSITEPGRRRSPEPRTLLCIGRLEGMKGQDTLIDAATRLMGRYPDLRVRLAGADTTTGPARGSMLEALLSRIEPEFADRFEFLGRLSKEAIAGELHKATIVVAPSRWDNMPYAIVEAMLAGAPVVATTACGLPELIEHGLLGLLAPPEDASALAGEIARLLDDPDLSQRLARAARERAIGLCDPGAVARATIDALCTAGLVRPTGEPAPLEMETVRLERCAGAALSRAIERVGAPLVMVLREGDRPEGDWPRAGVCALARDPGAAAAIPSSIVPARGGSVAQAVIPLGLSRELLALANTNGPLRGAVVRTQALRDALDGAPLADSALAWGLWRRLALRGARALCMPMHAVRLGPPAPMHRWPVQDLDLLADLAGDTPGLAPDPERLLRLQLQHAEALLTRRQVHKAAIQQG